MFYLKIWYLILSIFHTCLGIGSCSVYGGQPQGTSVGTVYLVFGDMGCHWPETYMLVRLGYLSPIR